MKKHHAALRQSGLFDGAADGELDALLLCLDAHEKIVRRGAAVLRAGDKPRHIGVVLEGRLHISRDDINGDRALIAAVSPGEIFAEALCCASVNESPVTVTAECDSAVMLLPFERILHTCGNVCAFHAKLIENILGLIARKNMILQHRMDIISQRSIRARVLGYLEPLAKKHGGAVSIPFNREELADFLCVERSALSHELSRMKSDGLIDYRRNQFTLK